VGRAKKLIEDVGFGLVAAAAIEAGIQQQTADPTPVDGGEVQTAQVAEDPQTRRGTANVAESGDRERDRR
jgi:hypothetical protein